MIAIPRSTVPGIAWPAITQGHAAQVLALQFQYRRSERWSADRMRAHQLAQASQLATHAARTMPFWRQRLHMAGITPGAPLTEEAWSRIPILTRADAQDAGTALHCLSVPEAHGDVHRASTTGSSGKPLAIARSSLHQAFWTASLVREAAWMGFDLQAKAASVRRDPGIDAETTPGRRARNWGASLDAIYPTGPSVLFGVHRSLAEQVAWLLREDPDYLMSYPSLLALLAQHVRETGLKLKRLRGLRTLGEVVTPDLRALCQDVFGLGIVDCYTCEEAGYMALQCPRHTHLHVVSENILLEVLDEANRPCAPGQVGRVVITPLHNFAMPLLRYELGDQAEPGPACDCGRTLPVLRRILGRSRNRILLPNGETRIAQMGGSGFHIFADLRQFQVIQTSRTTLEILLAARRPLGAEAEAYMIRRFGEMLGYPFDCTLTYVAEIPRGPGGKLEDFRSRVL